MAKAWINNLSIAAIGAVVVLGLTGCDPGRPEREALKKQVEALQKENAALKRAVADLQQGKAAGGGAASNPLAGLSGLLGQLGKGNFKLGRRPPGRTAPMDPDLQRKVDRMVIEGLEKLSKNKDAKALVKEIMRAMKRDLERQNPGARAPQP